MARCLRDRMRSMSLPGRDKESGARCDTSIRCDVWFGDIATVSGAHLELLDQVEKQRRQRYRQPADQDRFVLGAALIRLVAAARIGTEPRKVRVERACPGCGQPHGKPQLPGTGLHVSISHSGDLVALALTSVAPVGVDVEKVTDRDVADLARSVVGPGEPIAVPADLYTYWCRKEAIVKATGDGLQLPFPEVVVSPADQPARLVSYAGTTLRCAVADLSATGGYAAAVAVLAAGRLDVTIRDAGEVLLTAAR
jgi:4'-phosphopantetheinyl transferase